MNDIKMLSHGGLAMHCWNEKEMNMAWIKMTEEKNMNLINKMLQLFRVWSYTQLVKLRPRMTFGYRDYHKTRKRGAEYTYGRRESCHSGVLQKHLNNQKIDMSVGQKECRRFRWVVERYRWRCEGVGCDVRSALDGSNSFWYQSSIKTSCDQGFSRKTYHCKHGL